MTETLIFASKNDNWTNQTTASDDTVSRRYGWCVAASAAWCKGRLQGKAETYDPMAGTGQVTIGVMQTGYRKDFSERGLLARTGVAGTNVFTGMPISSLKLMKIKPGVYYFANLEHAMATDTSGDGTFYWYDIESGLWKYDDWNQMYKEIIKYYKSSRQKWNSFRCALP